MGAASEERFLGGEVEGEHIIHPLNFGST